MKTTEKKPEDEMRSEYDFSKAERGKFYRPLADNHSLGINQTDTVNTQNEETRTLILKRKPNIKKLVSTLGVFEFRSYITVGELMKGYDLLQNTKEEESSTVFFNYILSTMVVEPKIKLEEIPNLDNVSLVEIVNILADILEIRDEFDATNNDMLIRDRFYNAFMEKERKVFKELSDSIQQSLQPMIKDMSSAFTKMASESISNFKDAVQKLADVNLKISVPALPDFQVYTKELTSPIQEMLKDVIKLNLPEPLFSNALITSGLNTPLIHSPTYTLPSIAALTKTNNKRVASTKDVQHRRLVDAYDTLSYLELSLRDLIEEKLRELHQDNWWKQGVPGDVVKDCEERKSQKEKPNAMSHHPISYAYVHDYRKIITRSDNWKHSFLQIFGNVVQLEACFAWVGNVRDAVAHARAISDDDYLMFTAGAHWIQSRIK